MRCLRFGILLLLCAALLAGCGESRHACSDLLENFLGKYEDFPSGHIYRMGADEWEEGALPVDMASILFTEDNGENAFSLCIDYAMFLSSSYGGGEIAFLRAENRADARRLSEMCAARITRVSRVMPGATILQDACVLREGTLVVLLLTPGNAEAKSICRELL